MSLSANKTILLVEDNPDDEAMTLFALEKNKIDNDVVIVRDGQEALDYLFAGGQYAERNKADVPDLILLDIKLPELNGIEVLDRIRAAQHTQLVPVVMLTTSDEESDRARSYELCANSFIRKPVDFDKFYDLIRQISVYWLSVNETPPSKA